MVPPHAVPAHPDLGTPHTHDHGDLTWGADTCAPAQAVESGTSRLSPITCDLAKLLLNGEDCSWAARINPQVETWDGVSLNLDSSHLA